MPERALRLVAAAAFFLSGFAALVYQIVWQRLLMLFSGADVYSSTLVVAAFMGGLGLGHIAGGMAADRISRRQALLAFAVAEVAIGLFSAGSRWLYYDTLYQQLAWRPWGAPAVTLILFFSLLWPTFFMGVSLPLLAKGVTTKLDRAAGNIGALYASNTLGAAAGAVMATWVVLPSLGLVGGIRVGAIMNLACALAILPFVGRKADSEPSVSKPSLAGNEVWRGWRRLAGWAAVSALSGLIALSLEILWFRLLGVMMKATAFTFGTLLAVYLTGIGGGAWIGSRLVPMLRRPDLALLWLQAAVGVSAALLFAAVIRSAGEFEWLRQYFGGYEPMNVREQVSRLREGQFPGAFLLMYLGIPAVLILPPTLLLGVSFPILQRVVQTDLARLGRLTGLLLVANVAGCVVGTVLTGWWLLDRFGTAAAMRIVTGLSFAFGIGAVFRMARKPARLAAALLLGAGVGVFAVLPGSVDLWAALHGTVAARMIAGEDASGLSVFRVEPAASGRVTVFVNGVGQSTIPYGDIHTGLGMVPVFVHPAPRDVAIIGLGSGDTVYAAAGRREVERITCIEIIRPQLEGLRRLGARQEYGGVTGLLEDPRVRFVEGDGRIFLMRSPAMFDIIEADALRPTSAYSGNLYSEEYFRLVRSRLRPNGLAATWLPTERVHNAFVRVFPHVVSVAGMLVGSADPIPLDRDAIAGRIADPRVRAHYARAGIDAGALMTSYLAGAVLYTPEFDRESLVDVNSDVFPRDEFDLRPSPRP